MAKQFIIFFLLICFTGCQSLRQPKEVFELPDYTEEDVREHEKKRIEEISKDKPIQALWRAILLEDKGVIDLYKGLCTDKLKSLIQEKKYFEAYRYYISLKAVDQAFVKALGEDENTLYDKVANDIPGLNFTKKEEALLPVTPQDCINATVTIWVDKGIKIENGYGFADRVLGSGFFIDHRGYIITNHHVIEDLVNPKHEGYTRLYIKLAQDNETRIPAKVIGFDDVLDIALLKAEIDPPFVLKLGDKSGLEVGDSVQCIGSPLGLHGTITSGIVSATDRKLFTTGSVFQIDAAVNSGNSGGPCIDKKYRVQAIVFAGILQFQGLNFAIPVEYLRQDLPYLYSGGKRHHPWLNSYGHTYKEGRESTGVELQYIMPGGVTSRCRFQRNDIITFINDKRVHSIEEIQDILRSYSADTLLKITYLRDGEVHNSIVYLEDRPDKPGYEIFNRDLISNSLIPIFGMELTPCSTISRRQFVITNLIKGSIADESGFSVTDTVTMNAVDFSEDKSAIAINISTRKKKHGFLDVSLRLAGALDSPYYF